MHKNVNERMLSIIVIRADAAIWHMPGTYLEKLPANFAIFATNDHLLQMIITKVFCYSLGLIKTILIYLFYSNYC